MTHPPFINMSLLSRWRGEMMGVAIVLIILFHTYLPRTDAFFGLRRMGNIGVDMFLFLSGMGLWYSWQRLKASEGGKLGKQTPVWSFYRHRFWRIYPVWLIMASLFYIPLGGSWAETMGDVLINKDFWLRGELTFWYVPAIMMLYLWAPLYIYAIERWPVCRWLPVLAVVWCVAVEWVLPIHESVGHLEIFFSRIPIFLIGINMATAVKDNVTLRPSSLTVLAVAFLALFALCLYLEQERHGLYPLFVGRMLYIPLTVISLLFLSLLFSATPAWLNQCFKFLGAISLEIYLIHLNFVIVKLQPLHLGFWPAFLLTAGITIPLAWLLHWCVKHLTNRFVH